MTATRTPRTSGRSTASRRTGSLRARVSRPRRPMTTRSRRAAMVVAGLLALLSVLIVGHQLVPNGHGLGSLWESFLPWTVAPIIVLGLVAFALRSRLALGATALAVLAWVAMFGPMLLPRGSGGNYDLRVLSHNVYADNADPAVTARDLRGADADVIALQELTDAAIPAFHSGLDRAYPHHFVEGTLGLWSRFPIADVQPVDVGMGWVRALRFQIRVPRGDVVLYVVHLASIRVGADGLASQRRDRTMHALADAVAKDPAGHVVLAGDLNTAETDRSFAALTRQLTSTQELAGRGFGFTWPANFPVVAVDHILSRGLTVTAARVLGETGSDHRPVEADFRLGRR